MATPAMAISDNHVNKIVSIGDEFDGDTGVVLTIKEDEDYTTDFQEGDVFQLVLPSDVDWRTDLMGIMGPVAGRSVSDQIYELTFTGDVNKSSPPDTITVNLAVTVDGAEGDIAVEIDQMDSGVTGGKYVFARVSGDKTTAKAISVETIGDPGQGGDIRIEETSLASLGNDKQYIKLKLPSNFDWDAAESGTNDPDDLVTFSGGFSGMILQENAKQDNVNDNNYNVAVNGQEMYIYFDPPVRNQRGIITVDTMIDPSKDANYGDVEVSITGSEADDADVIVAKYADYGVKVTIDEVKDITAGKFDQELDTITIEEDVPGTFIQGRDITVQFPSWVKITDCDVKKESHINVTPKAVEGDDNEIDITITTPSNSSAGKIELDFEISVEGNRTGDIEVTLTGSKAGLPETIELVVGKAIAPVDATIDAVKDLKIGVQEQELGNITIVENKKEAISDTANGDINSDITIELPEGVKFAYTPTVEVVEGNLDIDEDGIDLSDANGGTDNKLVIPVDSASSKASKIEISDIKVTIDRTVPTGSLVAKVGGGAIIENQKANKKGWLEGTAVNGSGDGIDEGEFETDTAVKINVGTIVTAAPGETTNTAVFTIGDTKYTVNGIEKDMDASPYIKNSRTYMPLRFVAYAAGVSDANIIWNDADKSVVLIKGDRVVKLVVDSTTMYINGVAFNMDVDPEIVDPGRTMLPIRWVAQALGCEVTWDEATQTVTVK